MMFHGKNSLLPPKIPFPSVSPSYNEYIPNLAIGSNAFSKPREGSSHQRTSSESFLIEEQPSWLNELLDEPDTPVRKGGHRRSSSDSFAYIDTMGNYVAQYNKYNNITPMSSCGSQDLDMCRVLRPNSYYTDPIPSGKTKNKPWDALVSSNLPPRDHPSTRIIPNAGTDRNRALMAEKKDPVNVENIDHTLVNSSTLEADTKRAKQKFAQRSRVRKLQYIAALERNVQALEGEGSEVSAEFEFLNQQNMILSMENKALKHKLDSLSQEHLIKHLEHEVLEREVGRLRNLYHQQQQQMMTYGHHRSKSRDLNQQFATLSLKQKEASPDF